MHSYEKIVHAIIFTRGNFRWNDASVWINSWFFVESFTDFLYLCYKYPFRLYFRFFSSFAKIIFWIYFLVFLSHDSYNLSLFVKKGINIQKFRNLIYIASCTLIKILTTLANVRHIIKITMRVLCNILHITNVKI